MWKVKEVFTSDHTNETNKTTTSNNNVRVQGAAAVTELFTVLHFVEFPESKVCRGAVQAGSDAISFYNDKNMEVSKGKSLIFFGCIPYSNSNFSFEYLLIHLSVYFLRYPNRLRRKLVLLQTISSLASNILLSRSLILCKQLQLQHNTSSAMANVELACHKVIKQFQTTAGIFRNKYDKLKTAIVIRTIVLRPSCEKTLIAKLPNNGIPNQ